MDEGVWHRPGAKDDCLSSTCKCVEVQKLDTAMAGCWLISRRRGCEALRARMWHACMAAPLSAMQVQPLQRPALLRRSQEHGAKEQGSAALTFWERVLKAAKMSWKQEKNVAYTSCAGWSG